MTKIITVPAAIEKVETRADRTAKINVGTSSELSPDETAVLFGLS